MATTTPGNHTFLQPATSVSDSLLMTLFIAAVIHVIIFLGVRFSIPQPLKVNKQIEITLASLPSKKAPKNAKYLAQDNQEGSGTIAKKPEPTKQKLVSQGDNANKPPKQRETQTESKPKATQKLITQKQAEQQITITKEDIPSKTKNQKLSIDALKQQISQLGEEIRYSQQGSDQNKLKNTNTVSARKYARAQYLRDWETKVKRIARLNSPPKIKSIKNRAILMLRVDINSDGSINNMQVKRSSGNKTLDDYAKRIVRLGAPYPTLPKDLHNTDGTLQIIRTWNFPVEKGVEIQ